MTEPPRFLDGASVVCWTISPVGSFYSITGAGPAVSVAAMAVCRYDDSGAVYLFKCDANWDAVQDWDCGAVEEAQGAALQHAHGQPLEWHTFRG